MISFETHIRKTAAQSSVRRFFRAFQRRTAGKPRRGQHRANDRTFSPFKVCGRQALTGGQVPVRTICIFSHPSARVRQGARSAGEAMPPAPIPAWQAGSASFPAPQGRLLCTPQIVSRETIRQANSRKKFIRCRNTIERRCGAQGGNHPRNAAVEPLPVQQASGTVHRATASMRCGSICRSPRHCRQSPMHRLPTAHKVPDSSTNISRRASVTASGIAAHSPMP